ncbi:MAG: response regulator, partial [Candidatus Sericytochromatia bacterium]|nr:response regulator [Candidatus Sericytochromatia bacterium]
MQGVDHGRPGGEDAWRRDLTALSAWLASGRAAGGEPPPFTAEIPEMRQLADQIRDLLGAYGEAASEQAVLQDIIANLPHRIFWKDRQGRFLGGNANFLRDLGIQSPAEFIGKTDYDMPYPRDQADWFRRIDEDVMQSGEARLDVEEVMDRPDGAYVLSTSKVPRCGPNGEVVGTLGIYVDITGRKRAEEEIRRLYERLQELDQLKSQFFANVSHELRTPLTLILGQTDRLMREGGLTGRPQRDLLSVIDNAKLLLKHVNDLLDIAKLDAGKMVAQYAAVDVARLVRLGASLFDVAASDRHMTFTVAVPAELEAEVDAEKVQRILINLLANAFKFSPAGGRVHCQLTAGDGHIRLVVADSGPGVPAAMRAAIFERFVQAEGAVTRRFGGTGLGLAIAREFAELHGGRISVGDAPQGGALFVVELPQRAPAGTDLQPAAVDLLTDDTAVQQTLRELRTTIGTVRDEQPSGRPLVLVVEDNPEMNRFVAEILSDGYRIATAFDGVEGLAMATALRPDLIVSDVMMPRMAGDQLVAALRADPTLDGTPVMLLTAKADDKMRVALLRSGAQDYVMKPFVAEELLARVGNLVTAKRARDVLQLELESQTGDLEVLATEVSRRKRELQTALESVQVAREQAELASQMKTDFLRLVSHELRTPLTILQLHLQRLSRRGETGVGPELASVMRKMTAAAQRLFEMVNSLLQYVRIESGQLRTANAPIDLTAMVADVLAEWQETA